MKATFIGHPSDRRDANGSVTFYGVTFPLNEPVDISHLAPKHQDKLRGNGHFRVTDEDAPEAPKPARPVPVEPEPPVLHPAMTAEAEAKRAARAAKKAAKEQG